MDKDCTQLSQYAKQTHLPETIKHTYAATMRQVKRI